MKYQEVDLNLVVLIRKVQRIAFDRVSIRLTIDLLQI